MSGGGPEWGGFPSPPRWLEPVLVLAERVDRRRRRIRPIRPIGVIGIELARYRGPDVRLVDGITVRDRDPIAVVHFRNERVRANATSGWQAGVRRLANADLDELGRLLDRQPVDARPVALNAVTVLGPLLRREGWEIHPRPVTLRSRIDDWFMGWLLGHWRRPPSPGAPGGARGTGGGRLARLGSPRGPVRAAPEARAVSVAAWFSTERFIEARAARGRHSRAGGDRAGT